MLTTPEARQRESGRQGAAGSEGVGESAAQQHQPAEAERAGGDHPGQRLAARLGGDVFPHMVFGSYGTQIDEDLTDRLIISGVDMFLSHYAPHAT
ncbi:hypothetical protein ACIRPX_33375 [Streptomyces sp. NPDC101225]|uniref:hypothetical protein n=1 Tax=Streptomyces sp. NPDC101225 TaxID=3366135 RepID=UPI0038280E03